MRAAHIEVHPSRALFHQRCKIVLFTITNTSKKSTRVHIIRPISSHFFLSHHRPSFLLAPGLQHRVHVHCKGALPEGGGDQTPNVFDRLLIRTGTGDIEVPLLFERIRANLNLVSRVTLSAVSVGAKATAAVRICNEGDAEGRFSLVAITGDGRGEQITITPNTGVVPAFAHADVDIELQSAAPAIVKRIVIWQLDERVHHMDLTAEFAESRFDLIGANQVLVTDPIDFGLVHMGAHIQRPFTLFNSSPVACRFRVQIYHNSRGQAENEDAELLPYRNQFQVERGPEPVVLSATPSEGILAPYQSTSVFLNFKPNQAPIIKGFKSQLPTGMIVQYQASMIIEAADDPRRILTVAILAAAAEPNYAISIDRLSFGSCPVNETCDVSVRITNVSEALDLPFKIHRPAHFKCEPMAGLIPTGNHQDVIISFVPRQLGLFQGTVSVELGFDRVVSIEVMGRSSTIGKRCRHLTGTEALPADFYKSLNLIDPLPYDTEDGEEGQRSLNGTDQPATSSRNRMKAVRSQARQSAHADSVYAYSEAQQAVWAEHRHKYDRFLKRRAEIRRRTRPEHTADSDEYSADLPEPDVPLPSPRMPNTHGGIVQYGTGPLIGRQQPLLLGRHCRN